MPLTADCLMSLARAHTPKHESWHLLKLLFQHKASFTHYQFLPVLQASRMKTLRRRFVNTTNGPLNHAARYNGSIWSCSENVRLNSPCPIKTNISPTAALVFILELTPTTAPLCLELRSLQTNTTFIYQYQSLVSAVASVFHLSFIISLIHIFIVQHEQKQFSYEPGGC